MRSFKLSGQLSGHGFLDGIGEIDLRTGSLDGGFVPGIKGGQLVDRGAKGNGSSLMVASFEDIVEPGSGLVRHIHHNQDEIFLFLEGMFDVEVDGELFRMTAGDVALVPRGSVHTWKNVGSTRDRLRYIFSPASNIEAMFREVHEIRQAGELTEEMMEKIAGRYPQRETVEPPLTSDHLNIEKEG